jgi:hypothetical protein
MEAASFSDAPVEVISLRRTVNTGALRAIALVKVGPFLLHGVRVIKQDGMPAFVAFPQVPLRKRADDTGTGWAPTIEVADPDLFARIKDVVIRAWGGDR